MAIGTYVGAATVGGATWWFMYSPEGPQMTYWQVVSTHLLQQSLYDKLTKVFSQMLLFAAQVTKIIQNTCICLISLPTIISGTTNAKYFSGFFPTELLKFTFSRQIKQ